MLMKGGRPLSELTAEEIDQLINQKSAEMDNMKQNQRRDSAELNSTNRLRENLRELENDKPKFVPNLSNLPKPSGGRLQGRPQTGRIEYSKKEPYEMNRYELTAHHEHSASRREGGGRSASASLVDRYDRNITTEQVDQSREQVRENSASRPKPEDSSLVSALREAAEKNRELQSELHRYKDMVNRAENDLTAGQDREMTLKNRIKEIEEVFEEEKRKLKDRIKDLEHDGLQTRAEIEFKEDTLNNLQGRFEHVQLDLEKAKEAYRSQEEELKQMHLQNCRLLKSTEDELAAVKAESTDLEVEIKKRDQQYERTEIEISNRLLEAEQEVQRALADLKESEYRAARLAEQHSKEKEFLEKRYLNEKEKNKDIVHSYEQRLLTIKDELKLAEKDNSLLKKSNSFLEKRVVKREKGSQFDESLKNEMKKLLGISIELTADIMNFAKGEKVMLPLFKTFQHRQLNIEKKYKKLRSELNQKVTLIGQSEYKEPIQKSPEERKRSSSRKSSNRTLEVRGVMTSTLIKRPTPKNRDGISARSRGGSLTSKHSQGSKASYRSTSKGKLAKKQDSARKERPDSRSHKKRLVSTEHEKSIAEDTNYVGIKRHGREVDSIGDLSRDLSRLDGRSPMFFEGSDAGRRSREPNRRGLDLSSNLQSTPMTRTLLIEEQVSKLSREDIKKQIRESEDQIIALKKVYREKLEKRQISTDVGQMARQREELTQIANDIETRSQNLLQMRKQLRESVLASS